MLKNLQGNLYKITYVILSGFTNVLFLRKMRHCCHFIPRYSSAFVIILCQAAAALAGVEISLVFREKMLRLRARPQPQIIYAAVRKNRGFAEQNRCRATTKRFLP